MSPCMENSLWKRLWTCCQTDCGMVTITSLGLQSRLFPSDFVILKILRVSHFSYALFKYTVGRIKLIWLVICVYVWAVDASIWPRTRTGNYYYQHGNQLSFSMKADVCYSLQGRICSTDLVTVSQFMLRYRSDTCVCAR
jgi:hypothetical protein